MGQTTAGPARALTPLRRLVRISAFLITGIVGVIIGLAILSALARPAGAATLPVGSITPGTPSVALVPAIQNAPVVTPVSRPVGPTAAPTSLPTAALRPAAPAAVPSIGSVPSTALTAVRSLDSRVSGVLPMVSGDVLSVTGGVLPLSVPAISLGDGLPSFAAPVGTTPGVGDSRLAHSPGRTASPGTGTPSSGRPPTPLSPAPLLPFHLPRSPLTAGDANVASITGQGTNPFGSLPPSSRLLPVLAFGAVLLARRKTPRLLLDARCSPPG